MVAQETSHAREAPEKLLPLPHREVGMQYFLSTSSALPCREARLLGCI